MGESEKIERFAGHNRGVEVTQDGKGGFYDRPLTHAELIARDVAAAIQDNIFKYAGTAGVCYYPIFKLVAAAIQDALNASPSPATPEAEGDAEPMKLLFSNDWLRSTVPNDVDGEPSAGNVTGMNKRFFVDHGVIHDRKTGQHIGMDAEADAHERLFKLLCELDKAASPIPALGEAHGVFISIDDYHPNPAHELAIHRNDCGVFQAFYSKHAGGGLGPKSCLICGKSMVEQAVGIQHMELEDIVVCSTCTRLARIPEGEPFGHIHLHALSWVTHERWLKMPKMEQEWYPIPIGKFVDTRPAAPVAPGETK